jgi:hypothetical protein
MIRRPGLIDELNVDLRKSILKFKSILPYDFYIVAVNLSDLKEFKAFEERNNFFFSSRKKWISAIEEQSGVLFFITSEMFYRKSSDPFIKDAIQEMKKYFELNNLNLYIEIKEGKRFDAFFIGKKKANQKETEEE